MNIDGKFDEEKWKNVRWLYAEDKPNATQSAKIEFASFVGEKGIFIGGKVEETGSNIWVNPDRGSWTNSCLEMYIGPVGYGEEGKHKTIEYDVQADGSVNNMRVAPDQSSGFDIHTTWDKMPLTAARKGKHSRLYGIHYRKLYSVGVFGACGLGRFRPFRTESGNRPRTHLLA